MNLLFLLVEQLAQWLSEEVVDFPVAEEQVIGGEQTFLVFVLFVVFLHFFVADNFLDHWHVDLGEFVSELFLRILHNDGVARIKLWGVNWEG